MPGRGPQTFKKRQKEQQRKERQEEKMARRLARKNEPPAADTEGENMAELDSDSPAATESEQPATEGLRSVGI
jgi:hypothetical protein